MIGIILRTIMFYFVIILTYRLMGKREIAQLSISDLTISMLIAELVALGIEGKSISLSHALVPIFILVVLSISLAYLQLKYNKLRLIFDGKPSLIIEKGKLNLKEMIKQRFSIDDLLLELRNNGITSIKEVSYCILETNGKVSLFKKDSYPLPLIVDGNIDYKALCSINKNETWLINKLHQYNLKDLLYAFYQDNHLFVIHK